jgi:hypothetical protein
LNRPPEENDSQEYVTPSPTKKNQVGRLSYWQIYCSIDCRVINVLPTSFVCSSNGTGVAFWDPKLRNVSELLTQPQIPFEKLQVHESNTSLYVFVRFNPLQASKNSSIHMFQMATMQQQVLGNDDGIDEFLLASLSLSTATQQEVYRMLCVACHDVYTCGMPTSIQ